MKINCKKKGSRVELEIAKKFTERFGVKFFRTPFSGSFYTNNKIELNEHQAGDIYCEDDNFKFCIEIKARKDISFFQFLNGYFDNFILQAEKNNKNKEPLLIIKINNHPIFCLLKKENKIKYGDYGIFYLKDLFSFNNEYFFIKK